MSRNLLLAAAFSLIAGSACAADAPKWAGLYAGFNVGGGFEGSKLGTYTETYSGAPDYSLGLGGRQLTGPLGGVQAGYNWRFQNYVVGAEADAEIAGVQARSFASDPSYYGLQTTTKNVINSFGTVRGRFGYAFDKALVYATAGYAYANDHRSQSVLYNDGYSSAINHSGVTSGYAAGAGVEYAVAKGITAKIEYLYLDFGARELSTPEIYAGSPTSYSTNVRIPTSFSTVRFGLNYKLNLF